MTTPERPMQLDPPGPGDDRLIAALSPNSPVRQMLVAALNAGHASDEELTELSRRALDSGSWEWRERGTICRYLGRLAKGERHRAEVARVLAGVIETRRREQAARSRRLTSILVGAGVALVSAGSVYGICVRDPSPSVAGAMALTVYSALPLWLTAGAVDDRRLTWIRKQALSALGDLAMPGTLPMVARAASAPNHAMRNAARAAILPVLRGTTPDHYGHLGAAVLPVLQLLETGDNELRVAALDALGRFADGRAVAEVERIAAGHDAPEVVRAARAALPVLLDRQRRERDASRLLRPADAPPDQSILLRPAASAEPGEEKLLLRPIDDNLT